MSIFIPAFFMSNIYNAILKTDSIFYEKYQTPSLYTVSLFSVVR
ncbi:hypothetical protein SAMN05444366_1642 [Flavobacterium saccharophilum]|uniref:Uncharacterized protein n=1 Tax=Flavobacterium saccharophilum TaxID=29534 RepID=A0A1M7DPC0_9FLAO|nr:hypothetical protein SAMN05444366_1642 [Flavobacterium saccharophilum]